MEMGWAVCMIEDLQSEAFHLRHLIVCLVRCLPRFASSKAWDVTIDAVDRGARALEDSKWLRPKPAASSPLTLVVLAFTSASGRHSKAYCVAYWHPQASRLG